MIRSEIHIAESYAGRTSVYSTLKQAFCRIYTLYMPAFQNCGSCSSTPPQPQQLKQ